jgi:hypothetical protein
MVTTMVPDFAVTPPATPNAPPFARRSSRWRSANVADELRVRTPDLSEYPVEIASRGIDRTLVDADDAAYLDRSARRLVWSVALVDVAVRPALRARRPSP